MEALLVILVPVAVLYGAWILAGYLSGCDPFPWYNAKRVYLVDTWGEVYKTYARTSKDTGKLYAYVYPGTKVGPIYLNDDGTITPIRGGGSYIKRWSYNEPLEDPI